MKNLIFCDLVGSHQFLNAFPLYVYALIFVGFYLLLLGGRKLFEGKAYNVARSADMGDAALTFFIILAARVIQKPNFNPAGWMETGIFHWIVAGLSFLVIIYFLLQKPRHIMDFFHAIVIAPIFFYLIITTIPIYWCYTGIIYKIIGLLLLLAWAALVVYDTKKRRLDQRHWIMKHRPDWKFKN